MTGSYGARAPELAEPARPAARAWRRGLRQRLRGFARRRLAVVGAALVALEVLLAVLAPGLAPYPPNAQNFMSVLQPPGATHWLGTDDLGRDILSRLLFGARISLRVGLVAVLLAVAVGVPLGLVVGYVGGRLDEVVMRVVDSLMSLPPLVLALTITAVLGSGIQNAMIAIAVVSIPTYTRLTRGQVLSVRENDYIRAIVASGAATPRILFRHILPNSIQPIIVQGSLGVGFAIITESSLSFIGLGAQPPTATWGSMVQVGFQYLETAPWFVLAPALMIFTAVLGFNVLGDGLRDALDPSLRT
jgi:ABC-type dipeptide/oligopeptide/nickel transport system permease subunit